MSDPIRVRPATAEDLPVLERQLPLHTPSRHRECLADQADGRLAYLVAWRGPAPVGHGLIHWAGPRDPSVRHHLPDCPEIFMLGVPESLRSQGIGRTLLAHLERVAADRGARRIGLGVALTNLPARRLYEGLGYREVGAQQYVDRWYWVDASGTEHVEEDPCVFLVKELPTGEITGATRLLALIADPVVQARSPAMANALLRKAGRFGAFVLVPMHVPGGALPEVVGALSRIGNFAGAIVSMPHKTAIVTLLDRLTPEARQVGAVNVIRKTADGGLEGSVLDGEGFVSGLQSAGHEVVGRSCLLVGAGGAAAAIAFSLANTDVGRWRSRTDDDTKWQRWRRGCTLRFRGGRAERDSAVHTTSRSTRPLGMKPDDGLPMERSVIERSALIADCVLAPEMTRLLLLAKELQRVVHPGLPMLNAQMDLILRFMGVEP
jgi:shikimate dehydrogenase